MYIYPISTLRPIAPIAGSEEPSSLGASASTVPFANVLGDAVRSLKETQVASEQAGYELAMGTTDNLGAAMIASAKATAALELTVELSSRAMSAYKEIMSMQV